MPSPADFPARLGRYVIERILGRGPMGVVYLAFARTPSAPCLGLRSAPVPCPSARRRAAAGTPRRAARERDKEHH